MRVTRSTVVSQKIVELATEIGKILDIPMFDALEMKKQHEILTSGPMTVLDYFVLDFYDDYLSVITFDPWVVAQDKLKIKYRLDLKTFLPTNDSEIKKQLPKDLINKIKECI